MSFKYILVLIIFSFFCNDSYAVNILQFTRSNSLTFEMLEDTRLPNSHVFNDYDMIFTLGESWVKDPLVFKNPSNSAQLDEVIEDMYSTHLGFGAYFTETLFLGATTAYSTFKTVDNKTVSDFTDIHMTARWRFLTRKLWAMSLIPQVSVPLKGGEYTVVNPNTNSAIGTSNFLSDDSFGFGAKVAIERLFSWGQVLANVGYRHSEDAKFITNLSTGDGINMEQQLYTAVGAYIPITKKIGTNIEWARLWSLPFNNNLNPNEFYTGLSGGITKTLHAFGGLSFGNPFADDDGNDIRVSAGVKYTPKFWSKPRKLYKPKAVAQDEASDNLCENKHVFEGTNVIVVRYKNDTGSISKISNEIKYVLDKLSSRIDDIEKITVIGHTSTPGSEEYNLKLSRKRAASIKGLLISGGGIPQTLIEFEGRGESQLLISPETNKNDEAKNRRTEFKVKLKPKFNSCF